MPESSTLTGIPFNASKKGQGGIKKVFIAPFVAISNKLLTGNEITFEFEPDSFQEYYLPKQSGSYLTDTRIANITNGSVVNEQIVVMNFHRYQNYKRKELLKLSKIELIALIIDNNNDSYVLGAYKGLDLIQGVGLSGAGYNDASSLSITLRGLEKDPAYTINPELYQAILDTVPSGNFPSQYAFTYTLPMTLS